MAESFENLDNSLRGWAKDKLKKVLPRHWTGSRRRTKKDKAVSFRKRLRKNTWAVSVGSQARLNQAQNWSLQPRSQGLCKLCNFAEQERLCGLRFAMLSHIKELDLRSNNELLLVPPPVSFRPTLGGRTFSYAAPVEWNSLPSSIRHITSLATFKEHLKTYFYRKALL